MSIRNAWENSCIKNDNNVKMEISGPCEQRESNEVIKTKPIVGSSEQEQKRTP